MDKSAKMVRYVANGMMAVEVYEYLMKFAGGAVGDVLEIGTAHGAGTISTALGLPDGVKMTTVDRLTHGSRAAFGSPEDNAKIIRGNFETFGVENTVDLFVGSPQDIAATLDADTKFGMLILDADGMIDRDIKLFYDRLLPGAPIVIDDCDTEKVRLFGEGNGTFRVDQKTRLTGLFVDLFVAKGMMETDRVINDTWFGRKPMTDVTTAAVSDEDILGVYRELVKARGKSERFTFDSIAKSAKKTFPKPYDWARRAYNFGISKSN